MNRPPMPPAFRLVALADVPPQPWRNGGGLTRELLTWPPGQAAWQLRVSVADITRDGPFSGFAGVQRWFQVLSGAGVRLGLGAAARTLTPADPPWAFDGASAPACELLDGPTQDLNLMVQQAAGEACMQPCRAGQPWLPGPCWRGLFTTTPLEWQAGSDPPQHLPALSLLWSDADGQRPWVVRPDVAAAAGMPLRAWWLSLSASPARRG